MIGRVLGKYRIEAELSRGGMGAVYRARHEILDRAVAVKLLRPELTESDELVSRFVTEAKAASAIRHPGIIDVLDFGHTEDGQAYLVMEFLEGESLGARIQKRGPLPAGEASQIVHGIAAALTAAHAKGIVHRDLKPDNVFIVPDPDLGERAKVLDFGIAKLQDATTGQTQTGALMGTPLYMAPEQARAARLIDHRADLYSLGCIYYELLTGKPPFIGEGAGEIIALHMFSPPEPPTTRVPGLPPAIERIVLRLLEKEPEARFSSAAELASALVELGARTSKISLAPPMSRPATPTAGPPLGPSLTTPGAAPAASLTEARTPHREPSRRRAALPLLAGTLLVALAGTAVVVFALRGGSAKPRPAIPAVPSAPSVSREVPVAPAPTAPVAPPPIPVETTSPREAVPVAPVPPTGERKKRGTRPTTGSVPKRTTDKGSPTEDRL